MRIPRKEVLSYRTANGRSDVEVSGFMNCKGLACCRTAGLCAVQES